MKGPARSSFREVDARLAAIADSPSDEFAELARLAGLRPEFDLRFGDFADCPFDGDDLRGFDFTGCDLSRASFAEAEIVGAIFDSARVDGGALRKAADHPAFLRRDLARPPASRHRLATRRLDDLAVFREAPFAPEMVVLPAGEFRMGSHAREAALGDDDAAYGHEILLGQRGKPVRIPRRFALGRHPVTFEEFDVFCAATGRERPRDGGWGRDRRPAIHVSWIDGADYVAWLNGLLGLDAYRLPSEAEWEYGCRAGTTTRRWWGESWEPERANGARSFERGRTSPVETHAPNPWRLHDMIGNVSEWCADEYVEDIARLPENGAAFGSPDAGGGADKMALRSLRGGAWNDIPRNLRSAYRGCDEPEFRGGFVGFRLARTL
jgi:formylglycine-generating enzyme required for sulfatase activity